MIRRRHLSRNLSGRASFEARNSRVPTPSAGKRLSFAAAPLGVAFISVPQRALAQCAANPINGGILQNGGAPCTVSGNVAVALG
jgi:hypothetical protein